MKNTQNAGFTLIELMIAILIGAVLLIGIVNLFSNASRMNRVQNGLARLQENGRFAMLMAKNDVSMTGNQYCANISVKDPYIKYDSATFDPAQGAGYRPRALEVWSDTLYGGLPDKTQVSTSTPVPVGSDNPYPLDPGYFIRGHECSSGTCVPSLNSPGADLTNGGSSPVPAVGTTAGSRLANTDVLTVRYFVKGLRLAGDGNVTGGNTSTFPVISDPAIPFNTGDFAIVANCLRASVMPVEGASSGVVTATGGAGKLYSDGNDSRIYNLNNPASFRTVTYYIGLKTDPNNSSRVIPGLYRSVNGTSEEIVEGVDALDIIYGVQKMDGTTAYLTADQIDAAGTADCTAAPDFKRNGIAATNGPGCLWRSVFAVEIHALLNTVNPVATDSDNSSELNYVYTGNPSWTSPGDLPLTGQGNMYRREFTITVPIANYSL
jgi:type IV pilus assembly protein PilW